MIDGNENGRPLHRTTGGFGQNVRAGAARHQHAEACQRAAEGKGDPGEQRQEQRQNCAFDHIDAIRDADAEQFPERNAGQRQNRGEEKQSPVGDVERRGRGDGERSEEHTSELQSLMRISYAVFCLKKKNTYKKNTWTQQNIKKIQKYSTTTQT